MELSFKIFKTGATTLLFCCSCFIVSAQTTNKKTILLVGIDSKGFISNNYGTYPNYKKETLSHIELTVRAGIFITKKSVIGCIGDYDRLNSNFLKKRNDIYGISSFYRQYLPTIQNVDFFKQTLPNLIIMPFVEVSYILSNGYYCNNGYFYKYSKSIKETSSTFCIQNGLIKLGINIQIFKLIYIEAALSKGYYFNTYSNSKSMPLTFHTGFSYFINRKTNLAL